MSLKTTPTFDALTDEAVRRFLQTALVVDDRAVTDEAPAEDEGETEGRPLVVVEPETFADDELPPPPDDLDHEELSGSESEGDGEDPDEGEDPVALATSQINVKVVADAFADEGLTCGVLQPAGEANAVERIVGAGARADIVVIDWRLSDETGKTAADAVGQLVQKSATGKRLIAVYTTQRNLAKIAVALCHALGLEESEEPVIDAAGARIEILNKVGVKPDPRFTDRQVPEHELPRYLVGRFKKLVRGLVPVVALNALAATRENTHRLLERLGPHLDVGYAAHLMRLEHPDDAEQQLLDAVGDELQVVVSDDAAARMSAASHTVLAWIRERETDGKLSTTAANFEAHLDPNVEKPLKSTTSSKPRAYSALLVSAADVASANLSDARFAMLMSLTHHYQWPRPMLTLGTVVRDTSEHKSYWLCVQPGCDAVRLKNPTLFPMLRLEQVNPDEYGFDLVVPKPGAGNDLVYLWAASKPRDLCLVRIAPTEQEMVRFPRDEDGRLLPVSTKEDFRLEWVAQLKPAHAQRVAENLGREFARVGLDESEWLRDRAKAGRTKEPPQTARVTETPADGRRSTGTKVMQLSGAGAPAPARTSPKKAGARKARSSGSKKRVQDASAKPPNPTAKKTKSRTPQAAPSETKKSSIGRRKQR